MCRPVAVRTAGLAVAGVAVAVGSRVAGRALVLRAERRLGPTTRPGPYAASERARELHRTLSVVDLHADSLLWGRDLRRRGSQGQVDIPRLIEGNVALQVFAASTRVPRHPNLERNDDRSDDVTRLALAAGWPPRTWRSRLARALHLASRATELARSDPHRFTLIRSREDLLVYLERRRLDPLITAGLLSIEGAHALDDEPDNLAVAFEAGYRMLSLTHLADNAFGGSAHGMAKGGVTATGRDLLAGMARHGMIVDVAHASPATIDDILATASGPVVASHTGVRGTADNGRNLSDVQLRGIAETGGLVGIGFWPAATGGDDVAAIARAIAHAANVAGFDHVGLGSDFDGAVAQPIDATGLVQVTDALLEAGFRDDQVAAVMGGNALRLLRATLPAN